MTGSRRTQPYRAGPRAPGQALTAMLRGRTAGGLNPMDTKRALMVSKAAKRAKRPVRPKRPARPPR